MGLVIDISEEKISAGSSSRLIAESISLNLKDAGSNVIAFLSGKSAANTGNTEMVLEYVSGTWNPKNVPATVAGSGTISIDSDAINLSVGISGLNLRVDTTTISFISLNGLETKPKAQVIAELIANAQAGFIITNPSGDIIKVEEPAGQETVYEGQTINVVLQAGATLTTSGATTITGGSIEANTAIALNLDGDEMIASFFMLNYLAALVSGKIQSIPIATNLKSTSGDYVFEIVDGLNEDFIINVKIFGDTL